MDIGITGGIGAPGVASAQLSVGYGGGEVYLTAGGSLGGATVYAGYGQKSGFYTGVGLGAGSFISTPYGSIGSNLTSIGINYSQNGGLSYNFAGMSFDQNGNFMMFSPSIGYSNIRYYGWHPANQPLYSKLLASGGDGGYVTDAELEAARLCPTCYPIDEVVVTWKKGWYYPSGQRVSQISMDASHNRIGFVPLDVGENYGAFQMANYRCNISVRGNQNQITVRATSSNTPVADGQVVFRARASLVVNGNTTQTQVLKNGLAVFKLPSSHNVSLTVNGGWIVYYDYGGAAVD